MIHRDRETFISYRELLSRSAQQCTQAGRSVMAYVTEVRPPYREAMVLVAREERELGVKLEGYAEKSAASVICTRLQYKPEEGELPTPRSPDTALQNVTQVNRELVAILQDLADKSAPDTVYESLDAIRQNIDRVNKRISMILLTAQDV